MTPIKITELHSDQNELYQELSDLELEVIAGGLNPQPLPPGFIARHFIARQPEAEINLSLWPQGAEVQ